MSLSLVQFVRALADDMVLTPIYRKGAVMRSGRAATGKNPHEDGHDRNLNKHDAAHLIEKAPKSLKAIGIWTGVRGNGYLILDVDKNHSALKRKWGDSLQGAPVITSTRKNAAKYLLRAPEELWNEINGWGHSDEHAMGYEVLWGRQALIFGAYPGSSDGKAPEGEYGWEGDPESVPVAPDWLLAEMRAAKASEKKGGFIKSKRALDLADRTEDEIAQIVQECLSVIPHKGAGSNSEWVKIGMAIHSVLPGDLGLTLWSAWSAKDPEYADEWARGNPCTERWQSFKPGGINLGSLIWLADQVDPKRARFSDSSQRIVEEAEANRVQQYREVTLTWEEVYRRADAIFTSDHHSVGERRYELLKLAREAGITFKPVQELTEMYMAHKEKLTGVEKERSAEERWDNPESAHFYVPGLLCAGVYLMSGKGGAGKTNAAWAFASHFLSGTPLRGKNGNLSWERGNVLWLTGDQPDSVTDDQIRTHLSREQCKNLTVKNNFNINDYPTFLHYAKAHKPKLVVIDSLRSTHRGSGVSENDSEFALPLRWYEQNMKEGGLFEPAMVLVLHHTGHARGGARGTSALGDMTSFAADFVIPEEKDNINPLTTRLMTFTKHRFGEKGHQILCALQQDDTVRLTSVGIPANRKAATVQDRVLLKMTHSPKEAWTYEEIADDDLVGGKYEAVKKAVQRLVRQGQAEERGIRPTEKGKVTKLWGACGVAPGGFVSGAFRYSVSDVPEETKSTGTTKKSAGNEVVPADPIVPASDTLDMIQKAMDEWDKK